MGQWINMAIVLSNVAKARSKERHFTRVILYWKQGAVTRGRIIGHGSKVSNSIYISYIDSSDDISLVEGVGILEKNTHCVLFEMYICSSRYQ